MNLFNQAIELISNIWKPAVEITLFWFCYYSLLKFLRSTGALQVLKGLFLIFLIFMGVQYLGLNTISRLITEIIPISVIGFVVIFQSELRRGLTRIGQNPIFKVFLKEDRLVDEIVKAVSGFSKKKIGAIVAIEREIELKSYSESGISIDGVVGFELLSTIFMRSSPLHDGGVIIRGSRIESAGSLFPLSNSQRLSRTLGTRHRAALGLSEETDAFVIVVSEESGSVSVAEGGEFVRDVDASELRRKLTKLYRPQTTQQRSWTNWFLGEKRDATSS